MEAAISHRNQNITDSHAVGRADVILGGMVRIDGKRRLGKQQGRLFSLCTRILGFVAKMCQASYDSNAKTTLNNPTARHGRDTLHSPHRHSCGGRNLEARGASVRPEPVEACPEGTRRGPPACVIPRRRRNLTPCAGQHPDTAILPPRRCLRYRLPMKAISHRNQNITGPHAVGRPSLIVVGMVRIDGQRRLGKQQGRLIPLCKKLFGVVAKVCQASYDSNAKTTLNNPTARHGRDTLHSPHRHSCGGRNPEARGASVRPEPVEACPEGTRRGLSAYVIPTREREPHPLRRTASSHDLIAPTPVPPLPSPHGSNLPPQPEQHGSPCRRARRPDPWWHGPHRWSKAARQATWEVVSSPRKNSTRLDSNRWQGRHRTRPPQVPP